MQAKYGYPARKLKIIAITAQTNGINYDFSYVNSVLNAAGA